MVCVKFFMSFLLQFVQPNIHFVYILSSIFHLKCVFCTIDNCAKRCYDDININEILDGDMTVSISLAESACLVKKHSGS